MSEDGNPNTDIIHESKRIYFISLGTAYSCLSK